MFINLVDINDVKDPLCPNVDDQADTCLELTGEVHVETTNSFGKCSKYNIHNVQDIRYHLYFHVYVIFQLSIAIKPFRQ